MVDTNISYPVKLTIDYPDKPLDRLSSFFRIFYAIPIFIILALLAGTYDFNSFKSHHHNEAAYHAVIIFLPLVLMLLFRRKYPRWWFDWNLALVKFAIRVKAYVLLLRDEYPSTDDEQAIHLEIIYPDASKELNRWLPLVKWFLSIPHFLILGVLSFAALICTVIAWFAILFTGQYPKSMFDFVVGVIRWAMRVVAYAFLLVTDKYPPFSLSE